MISRFFIDRPVFATVLNIIIVLGGLAAMKVLPIAQYPEITPPTVSVSAVYPGATAEVVANTVAAPIEQQLTGLEGVLYIQSVSSSNGQVVITLTFEIGTNVDIAAINTRNRVNLAEPVLPQEVRRNGVTVQKKAGNMLLIAAIRCPSGQYDDIYLSNYASLNVVDALKRLPGAGDASIMGARDYSMRIWLKPDRLAQLGLTTSDVNKAIQEQNAQFPAGRLGQKPTDRPVDLNMAVTTRGRLLEPSEFENIILKANTDGSMVRIKDVARAELGSREYEFLGRLNGAPTTLISVNLQPGANALDLAKAVKTTLDRLSKSFPAGIEHSIPYDTTRFVEVSIDEVIHTLFEAVGLVFLVVFLFLQSWRATLIPALAVPVSLIGTFMGMYALGYSINTLTLFGLVLAIGIVVDDAIVVVENVERIMHDQGLPPKEATRLAMDEVTGPVIAIVLVLCAVFVPVAFLGGMAGQLYKQFAITIAISVIFSGVVALTLSPVLAVLLLKPTHGQKRGFFKWFNIAFDRITHGYTAATRLLIKRGVIALVLFAALLYGIYDLNGRIPSSFVPPEDQGYLFTAIQMPDAASLDRTLKVVERVEGLWQAHPAVKDIVTFVGYDLLTSEMKPNAAAIFVTLKDWKERQTPELRVRGVLMALMPKLMSIKEGLVVAFNPPAIPGLGTTGGFEFYVQDRGEGDMNELAAMTEQLVEKANQRPELSQVATTLRTNVPSLFIDLDRDRAKVMGVPLNDIFDTLQSLFGSLYVNDFNKFGRVYRVLLQAEPQYRSKPEDIYDIYVRSTTNKMIPLKSMLNVVHSSSPESIARFNSFPAAQITGNSAPGFSSGQAMAAMEEISRQVLPPDMGFEWSGVSYQEKKTGGQSTGVFVMGLVMVFLILAAQYEKWSLPFTVILAIPFGLFGALAAVWLRGMNNDVYFQIGLITLIGLAAKNAILIVEFAVIKHHEGLSVVEAALEAARLRFRPILMTSLAFILGVVPLVISSGAGAAGRHSIGTGVMGGMIAATFLAVFFVPFFFVVIQGLGERRSKKPVVSHDPQSEAPSIETKVQTVPEN